MHNHKKSVRRVAQLARLASCALIFALVTVGFGAQAFAEGGSVRYSYEKVEVGPTTEWVLMPRAATSQLSGTVTKSKVIAAFELLKRSKRSTYGSTSIQIKGSLPKAKVTVNIDQRYAAYALIIMAESVYTLTELGLDGVSFPGYAKKPVKRADIPFAVYTLNLPMWKALPPKGIMPTQVTMPDGTTLDGKAFYKRWKAKDQALVKALYDYLKGDQVYTITSVLALLPSLKLPYADQVIPLLKHEQLSVRQTALKTLAGERKNEAVLKAVEEMVQKEKDPKLARQAATWLGASKNKKYKIVEQFYLLEKGTPAEAQAAIKALGKFKGDDRVEPKLAAQLTNKNKDVALAAMTSLASINAFKSLTAGLKNDKIERTVRLSIAQKLSEGRDAQNRQVGLNYLANNGEERQSIRSIEALAKVKGDESRKLVEGFLTSPVSYRRQTAAKAIEGLNNPASLPAIAKAVKAKNSDAALIEDVGAKIMSSQKLKVILEQTRAKNKIIQRLAYRAVGQRAAKEKASNKVLDVLKAGTKNRDALIRGAAARALGSFANKDAAEALKGLAKDKSADVRRDVAVALANFKGGELANVLVEYLGDSDNRVKVAAMDALGARKEALAWDKIKALLKSSDDTVRAASLRALSSLVTRTDVSGVREIISLMSGSVADKSLLVRKEALRQLGTFKNETAVASIAAQLNAKEDDVRLIAFEALGNTGHSSAGELAATGVNDVNLKVRRAAIQSIAKLKASGAKDALTSRLKVEKDDEIKKLIKATLKKI